jgi:hypothetical protein
MRKLPVAAYKRPGEAALQKILVPREKSFQIDEDKVNTFLRRQEVN